MWELVPNTKVPEIKVNPLLAKSATSPKVATSDCCLFINNRKCIAAAVSKDPKAIKELLADTASISNPFQSYSVNFNINMLKIVVYNRDLESFKLVIDYLTKQNSSNGEKPRVKLPQIALTKQGTGFQNRY